MPSRIPVPIITILVAGAAVSCRTSSTPPAARVEPKPPIVQPGAPGQASSIISAEKAADLSQVEYTGADIKFMQGMISHHVQAVDMVALVPSRAHSDDLKKLALRIDLSQEDEIKMMQGWLAVRGQQVPDRTSMHMHGGPLMPGMLTADEMKRLADATGDEFDRLFLEGMIKHHGGALTMVEELFATPGAGQDSEIFAFASDVEADQRMEIDRMGAMLVTLKERQR